MKTHHIRLKKLIRTNNVLVENRRSSRLSFQQFVFAILNEEQFTCKVEITSKILNVMLH